MRDFLIGGLVLAAVAMVLVEGHLKVIHWWVYPLAIVLCFAACRAADVTLRDLASGFRASFRK